MHVCRNTPSAVLPQTAAGSLPFSPVTGPCLMHSGREWGLVVTVFQRPGGLPWRPASQPSPLKRTEATLADSRVGRGLRAARCTRRPGIARHGQQQPGHQQPALLLGPVERGASGPAALPYPCLARPGLCQTRLVSLFLV